MLVFIRLVLEDKDQQTDDFARRVLQRHMYFELGSILEIDRQDDFLLGNHGEVFFVILFSDPIERARS